MCDSFLLRTMVADEYECWKQEAPDWSENEHNWYNGDFQWHEEAMTMDALYEFNKRNNNTFYDYLSDLRQISYSTEIAFYEFMYA